jgi:hypothetical protein
MKKNVLIIIHIALAVLAGGCRQAKDVTPTSEFSPYVAAFTGDMITANAPVVVRLV